MENKKLICKHCKVEVIGRLDLRAVQGKTHARYCPRFKWDPRRRV